MKRFLEFIGYNDTLDPKNKFTYIINSFSFLMVTIYLIYYIIEVKSHIVNIVTILCLIDLSIVYIILKFKRYRLAKTVMVFGYFFQVFSIVFLWFPVESNLNYFFFIVTPVSFFIYDFEILRERIAIIIFNIIGIVLLLLSEIYQFREPLVSLNINQQKFLTILSILGTTLSISIVFYSYSNNIHLIHKELNYLANTDSLTKIYNRRSLVREGKSIFQLSRKYGRGFTLMVFDIDFFKKINDEFGHPIGDKVLIQVTELIQKSIRQNDFFFRYGGEEFALIIKDSTLDADIIVAENLRKKVESHTFRIDGGIEIKLTISIGVVSFPCKSENFEDMRKNADCALYKAKNSGRNKVVVDN